MKRTLAAISLMALLAILLSVPACKKGQKAAGKGGDATVRAEVGTAKITDADINKMLESQEAQMTAQGRPMNEDMKSMLKKRILDYLVSLELLQQEAKKRNIVISDQEITDAYNEEASRLGGEEQLKQMLTQRGMTLEALKDRIKQFLTIRKLQEAVTVDVPPVTAEEAQAYYDQNKAKFDTPETVHAFHILVKVDQTAPEDQIKAAEAKINDILQQAKKPGASFEELAKQYSDDPSGKQNGGDLGVFPKGRMVPEFEKVAFSLKVGQMSGPVRTPFGFHIIKVTAHNPPKTQTFEEVKTQVIDMLTSKKKAEAFDKFMEDLKTKTAITYPNPLPEPAPPQGMPGMGGGGAVNPHGGGMPTPPPGTPNPHGGSMPTPPPGTPNPHGATPPPPPPPPAPGHQ